MSPTKTTVKAAGKKNHKRLDHIPPHLFQHGFKPLRRHRNSPVVNGPNIQDSRATGQITDGEGPPRSIASPELYAHPPVGMAIPMHAGRRTPNPSSVRYNPWGNIRQRPQNISLGSDGSNFSNMAQVAEHDSQFSTQVQYIPGSHVSQTAPQPNPYEFAFSHVELYSPDPHTGAQQPWTSAAGPIDPIYYEAPYAANSFQLPEALPATTQNHIVPPTSYPYDYPLPPFPNDGNSMPSYGSIATPPPQFAIPVQQAMPDTLPGNVEFYDYLPFNGLLQ